jgi:hypothetical protein
MRGFPQKVGKFDNIIGGTVFRLRNPILVDHFD